MGENRPIIWRCPPFIGINPDRVVIVAVIYLDDSGTHRETPIITMAGYLFAAGEWEKFERRGRAFMKRQKVPVFHAKQFEKRRSGSPFAGWNVGKQVAFIEEWLSIARDHALRGYTCSLPKVLYDDFRRETRKNINVSVYGQCFNGILVEISDEKPIWDLVKQEGLSVVLELGNKNNNGVMEFFRRVRMERELEKELVSIGECSKDDCVAIQLADFLAYYSWLYAVEAHNLGPPHKPKHMPAFLNLAKNEVRTLGRLGDGFEVAPVSKGRGDL